MNKMKKLLSVVLAVVLALSCMSVMASAAKAKYQTVADLETNAAYSPYGQVTRLSSEERASMVQDFLDNVLPGLGINMGEVFNVLGLSVTLDLTSVDRLCYSLDTVADTFGDWKFSIAKGILNLGVLEELSMSTWNTGIDRAGDSQLTLFAELFQLLSKNTGLVNTILTDGLDLGMIGGMIKGLDLSSINNIVTNLPGLVKGLIFPLIERWDDTLSLIQTYDNNIANGGSVEEIANNRVKKLFSDNMSITTIKYDANGNMTSEHTNWLATATGSAAPATPSANSLRYYYQITGTTPGSKMYSYHIVDTAEAEALAKDTDPDNNVAAHNYIQENQVYIMSQEVEGSATYVWKAYALDESGNAITKNDDDTDASIGTLKYYNDNSPLLPGFSGDNIDLRTMSAGDLLYTFIPVLFNDMAPVVLNGSVKKLLAEFFGAQFTRVGMVVEDGETYVLDDAAAAAIPNADETADIFTTKQGDYMFEWSDYEVVNGNHYYRYLDDIYVGNIEKKNNYFDIINWDYVITPDFMDEFVPANDDDANTRLLLNLNDFLVKVATTITKASAETVDNISGFEATWTRPTFQTGNNSYAVENIKKAAQAVISLAPQHIFGSDYATNERCYYELLVSADNDTVLTGIAAMIVDLVMPSMSLPGKSDIVNSGAKVGAVLAAVVREFAAYLTPEYNYDALIYTSFENGTKTFVTGKDSEYWLDVILTMGINVGFEYLRAFADMGEDTTEWTSFVTASGYKVDGGEFTEADLRLTDATANYWEGMLDFIIDWALDKDYEWTWKMENLVEVDGLTIDMTTNQDPWAKLEKILGGILPVSEILTVNMEDSTTSRDYGTNKMEKFLRHDLILGIVDLRWDALVNTIQLNGTNKYFRTANVLDQLAKLLKTLVNSIFDKIGGGSYALIPSSVTDFDTLATQAGIRDLAVGLVGKLETAYNAGLLDTVFPFLGFLLGWQTNPQKIADPQIWTDFRNGCDYAYLYDNSKANQVQPGGAINGDGLNFTKIKILNNSSGMLEKHRNSDVVDEPYDINIRDIRSDATVNTLTFTYDKVVSPWETIDVIIDGTYNGEEATTVTIEYDYVGKDGQPIGGTQYTSLTFLVSNQYEDANIEGRYSGDDKDGKYGIDPYKKFVFTEDIYNSVTTFQPAVWGTNETGGSTCNYHWTLAPSDSDVGIDCDKKATNNDNPKGMNAQASKYFSYYQNRDGGFASSFEKNGSTSGKLYYANSGVTENTTFEYGLYDMGIVSIAYSDDVKFWEVNYIYYNDYDIYDIYTANKDNGYHANMGVDATIYNAYNDAWKTLVKYATYPMMTSDNGHSSTDYVATIMPHIEGAIEDYEAAKEAFEEALAEADANASAGASASMPSYVTELRQEIDNDFMNGKEINFQDYEFYEYFNYDDVKKQGETLYRTYLAPDVLDEYHIFRSGIRQAELELVTGAESNATMVEAINASRLVHDPDAVSASKEAYDNWQQPINTKLSVEDLTARLGFYKQFLNAANMEDNDHLYFLEKEIAFVEAQNLVAEDYESVTWSRYADALTEAKAVADGSDEYSAFNSRIYDVKYNLMVAYKQLLAKDNSLIEAGGTAELLANIEKAEAILAMNLDEIELSETGLALGDDDVAEMGKYARTAKQKALGHLVEALGYYYQARYTKHDIEVQDGKKAVGDLKFNDDGTPMMFNLYDESAYEYADNDRPNKTANQAKVNNVNANLEACIAYFVTEVAAPELDGITDTDSGNTGVVDTEKGYVYGVTAGADDLTLFFKVENGTFEMVANEGGYTNGTGATLVVKDTKGDKAAEYTLVVFGDVNGDAEVTSTDYAAVLNVTAGGEIEGEANNFAADVNGDTEVTSTDYAAILNTTAGGEITVNPYVA